MTDHLVSYNRATARFLKLSATVLILVIIGACGSTETAGVSGNWIGAATADSGSTPLEIVFNQEGSRLTGTVKVVGANNPSGALTGSVDSNAVSFSTTLDFGFASAFYEFEGNIDDEMISGSFQATATGAEAGRGTFELSKR